MELPEECLPILGDDDLDFELRRRNRFLRDARHNVKVGRLQWALRDHALITHFPVYPAGGH